MILTVPAYRHPSFHLSPVCQQSESSYAEILDFLPSLEPSCGHTNQTHACGPSCLSHESRSVQYKYLEWYHILIPNFLCEDYVTKILISGLLFIEHCLINDTKCLIGVSQWTANLLFLFIRTDSFLLIN